MKYGINGYEDSKVISKYQREKDHIKIIYLDDSSKNFDLSCEGNIKKEMNNQAKEYIKGNKNRFMVLLITLFSTLALGVMTINAATFCGFFVFSAISGNLLSLIGVGIVGTITYGLGKLTKIFIKVFKTLIKEYEDQDKYELFLNNEDELKEYNKTIEYHQKFNSKEENKVDEDSKEEKVEFDGEINSLDKLSLEQLKTILTEINKYKTIIGDSEIINKPLTKTLKPKNK